MEDNSWILQDKEIKYYFNTNTWVPLRSSEHVSLGNMLEVGFKSEYFGCIGIAFSPDKQDFVENKLNWIDINTSSTEPFAYDDGYYKTIEQYQFEDKLPIGINLVFEYILPVLGKKEFILNPDLVVALHLVKEGTEWKRPEEDFIVVAREKFNSRNEKCGIEIRREFLLDYLAARNLYLRLFYYRERILTINSTNLTSYNKVIGDGNFKLNITDLSKTSGIKCTEIRVWRNDVDESQDVPEMKDECDSNLSYERRLLCQKSCEGVIITSQFWRNEWIKHRNKSIRIRGDDEEIKLPFICGADGSSSKINDLDHCVGRWLWFRSEIIVELLKHRGFWFEWCTSETGLLHSVSGQVIHFGINDSDLVVVFEKDILSLPLWEQRIWFGCNVTPEGKISHELYMSQVLAMPADTISVEDNLFINLKLLEKLFNDKYKIKLFNNPINVEVCKQKISRFHCRDKNSLLNLAKELIKLFSDRINVKELRKLLKDNDDIHKLQSNKLLEKLLTTRIGKNLARSALSNIIGTYDMRVGDAHPTSSNIDEAIALAGIDQNLSYLKQGKQLIDNFGQSILRIKNYLS